MDLHLDYSRYPVLHRIFDGDDVDAAVLQEPERRVQGRRLSGSGWTSHEDQSFANLEQLLHARPIDGIEPKRLHRAECGARIEDADHDFFAV